jgi:predicted ATP-grasp superfamily ATP-dependent carboligase
MKVFVYEHITATIPSDGSSLHREGLAMRGALTTDLRAVKGLGVVSFPEGVSPAAWPSTFDHCVSEADAVWLVAPETGMCLASLADRVVGAGKTLLGPSPAAIRLATEKLTTYCFWVGNDVPTPETMTCLGPPDEWPVVVKPADGCGSTAVTLVRDATAWDDALKRAADKGIAADRLLVQRYHPGLAASVALLVGPNETVPLTPTLQSVSPDTFFAYGGGTLPLPRPLADRAIELARLAANAIPGLLGYVGVDLILGDASDGTDDVAVELNPRLTTSYVGLRALAAFNIAEAAIRCASGETLPPLIGKPGRLRFTPDGQVRWL